MNNSDMISISNIFFTVLATLCSPAIALWIGGKIQEKQKNNELKLSLFVTLMSLRFNNRDDNSIRSLNMIDVVFRDDREVRDAWEKYYEIIKDSRFDDDSLNFLREEKREELLMQMALALKLKKRISSSDIKRVCHPINIDENRPTKLVRAIEKEETTRTITETLIKQ